MRRGIILTFFTICLMVSCTREERAEGTTNNPYNPPIPFPVADTSGPRSFLALGDSYTIGQSVSLSDRFPVQAAKYLTKEGATFGDPEIIAQTGWTTRNLLDAIALSPPSKPSYDIVTLLIGVNNQHQGRSRVEYADEFLILLKKAIQYAGNNTRRVVVLSIPDYSVTRFANGFDKNFIAIEIDAFNEINRKVTDQAGISYLNITRASRLAEFDPTLVASDGLHPSGLQYKLWADLLVPVIKQALQ